MQRLQTLWERVAAWYGLPDRKMTEYVLIGAYSSIALFALVAGLTPKTRALFGPAMANHAAKPEFNALLNKLLNAGADFAAGASLLVIAVGLGYWNRRAKPMVQEPMASPAQSGPPFLF
ncbi:MAG TPA: hypothetical protein VKT81_26215 [Bryobacteraceae bacterium]|nr:hypothetical protein [Bryobacteraceae bacterium]